jgi:hypothetical protein
MPETTSDPDDAALVAGIAVVLTRKRAIFPGMPTMGTLEAGPLKLYTLELPWMDNDPETSCIPAGTYLCPLAWSDRYRQLMPRLLYVPKRTGILIHSGNYPGDTHGCILVGKSSTAYAVYDSRGAWALFNNWLGRAWASEPVFISIDWEPEAA